MEAAVFLNYLRDGTLADRDALESHLAAACRAADASAVPICPGDYVLGVADVGGELMRYAVAAAARGGVACAMHAREFMGTLQAVLETAGGSVATGVAKEIRQKKSVLAQSIAKVERACFDYAVRRAEFPDGAVPAARPGEDDAGATRAKRRRVE